MKVLANRKKIIPDNTFLQEHIKSKMNVGVPFSNAPVMSHLQSPAFLGFNPVYPQPIPYTYAPIPNNFGYLGGNIVMSTNNLHPGSPSMFVTLSIPYTPSTPVLASSPISSAMPVTPTNPVTPFNPVTQFNSVTNATPFKPVPPCNPVTTSIPLTTSNQTITSNPVLLSLPAMSSLSSIPSIPGTSALPGKSTLNMDRVSEPAQAKRKTKKKKESNLKNKTSRKLISSSSSSYLLSYDENISLHDSSNYDTDQEEMIRNIEVLNKKKVL